MCLRNSETKYEESVSVFSWLQYWEFERSQHHEQLLSRLNCWASSVTSASVATHWLDGAIKLLLTPQHVLCSWPLQTSFVQPAAVMSWRKTICTNQLKHFKVVRRNWNAITGPLRPLIFQVLSFWICISCRLWRFNRWSLHEIMKNMVRVNYTPSKIMKTLFSHMTLFCVESNVYSSVLFVHIGNKL